MSSWGRFMTTGRIGLEQKLTSNQKAATEKVTLSRCTGSVIKLSDSPSTARDLLGGRPIPNRMSQQQQEPREDEIRGGLEWQVDEASMIPNHRFNWSRESTPHPPITNYYSISNISSSIVSSEEERERGSREDLSETCGLLTTTNVSSGSSRAPVEVAR